MAGKLDDAPIQHDAPIRQAMIARRAPGPAGSAAHAPPGGDQLGRDQHQLERGLRARQVAQHGLALLLWLRRADELGADALGLEVGRLVLHQRCAPAQSSSGRVPHRGRGVRGCVGLQGARRPRTYERRDAHHQALADDGRQRVAERLAAAGGHEHEHILACGTREGLGRRAYEAGARQAARGPGPAATHPPTHL